MDAGREPLPGSDPFQQLAQSRSLISVQASADVIFMCRADGGKLPHAASTPLGQVKSVVASIAWVATAFDQPALLQAVDKQHQPRRRGAERAGKLLLAAARLPRDQAKQSSLGRGEVKHLDPLGEPGSRVRAELGQQERAPWPAALNTHS